MLRATQDGHRPSMVASGERQVGQRGEESLMLALV